MAATNQIYLKKADYIKSLADLIVPVLSEIDSIHFEAYDHVNKDLVREFLVIKLDNGQTVLKNISGDSFGYIVKVLGKLVNDSNPQTISGTQKDYDECNTSNYLRIA